MLAARPYPQRVLKLAAGERIPPFARLAARPYPQRVLKLSACYAFRAVATCSTSLPAEGTETKVICPPVTTANLAACTYRF